jgi:hypothetical protein
MARIDDQIIEEEANTKRSATTMENDLSEYFVSETEDGQLYYISTETQATVWELPEGASVISAPSDEFDSIAAFPLPGELPPSPPTPETALHFYMAETDDDVHYINTLTREVFWDLPIGGVIVEREEDDNNSDNGKNNEDNDNDNSIQGDSQPGQREDASVTRLFLTAETEDGVTYFFDIETEETMWELPENGIVEDS